MQFKKAQHASNCITRVQNDRLGNPTIQKRLGERAVRATLNKGRTSALLVVKRRVGVSKKLMISWQDLRILKEK